MIQVGGALGLAVLATLAATRTTTLQGNGDSQLQALTGGYHLAFAIGTGLMILAIVVAVTVLQPTAMPEHVQDLSENEPARDPLEV